MGMVLAALSALVYGTADFFGGLAARRVRAVVVAWVSQLFGTAALLALVAVWPAANASTADWVWGAVAGMGGGLGLAGFYRALSVGPMSVVAPVTAVTSALVPVLAGVAQGERPHGLSWIGVAAALPAIALVSTATDEPGSQRVARSTVLTALFAGVAFGLFFVAFGQTSPGAELWPLVAARAASVSLLGFLVLASRRRSLGIAALEGGPAEPVDLTAGPLDDTTARARDHLGVIAFVGIADTAANGLYLFSTHSETLAISAVLAAMYPVSTVLLARLRLAERFLRPQVVGLVLAAIAVALVAAGRALE